MTASEILRRARRTFGWWLALATVLHGSAIAIVSTIDWLRKRRDPPGGEFPRTPVRTLEVAGTKVSVYTFGSHVYDAMLESIRSAEHTIYFETFIWKDDEVGQRFKDKLIAAAERGVHVYLAIDSFGNTFVDPRFKKMPELDTLHVLWFPMFRPGLLTFNLRKTGRDHRKLLIVDGEVGYIGGYNIGSLYATQWRDTHARLEGPSVWELDDSFVDFWNEHRTRKLPELADHGARSWESRIRAAENAPSRLMFPIRSLYLESIDRAHSSIDITQAYFIPDREILSSLVSAAKRGVRVRVLIPEASNHVIADWAARTFYIQLLEAGVELWLFKDAMVHAKTMTIDGRWSTIGTANIDRMSMTGNFEVNVEIFDDELATHMEQVFATDLTNSRQLTLAEWKQRSLPTRMLEELIKPFGPLL